MRHALPSDPETIFLNSDGVLLAAHLPLDPSSRDVNLDVYYLTLNRAPVPKSVLGPFVHGEISTK